jgi:ABC-type nitrate/sulfonate/bicarbonate transport system substrate-binding protein
MAFTKIYLQKLGVDISKIEFIQLPPANHLQALEAGSIDILGTYDPVATSGLSKGNIRVVGYSVYARDFENTPLIVGIVNTKFATEQKETFDRFLKVYDRAYDIIQNDPEITYATIARAYKFTPEVARMISIPKWIVNRNFDTALFQKFINHLVDLKELEKTFDTSTIIIK